MENHHFQWVNPLSLWQFSIAIVTNYQRVYLVISGGVDRRWKSRKVFNGNSVQDPVQSIYIYRRIQESVGIGTELSPRIA